MPRAIQINSRSHVSHGRPSIWAKHIPAPKDGNYRHPGCFERPVYIRSFLSKDEDADTNDNKGKQSADGYQFTQDMYGQ